MKLSYVHRPGEEVILLLHGLGLNKETYIELFFSRTLQKYELLAPDLPGHGSSDRFLAESEYTFEYIAKEIVRLLNSLNIPACHLLVHSISSYLIPYLIKSGVKVMSIMMLEGNLTSDDAEWSCKMASLEEDKLMTYFSKLKKTAKFVLKSQLLNQHSSMHLNAYADGFSNVDSRALREMSIDTIRLLESGILLDTLNSRKTDCVYFLGADDHKLNKTSELLAQIGVEQILIKESAHYPHVDQPEIVSQKIAEFLSGHI